MSSYTFSQRNPHEQNVKILYIFITFVNETCYSFHGTFFTVFVIFVFFFFFSRFVSVDHPMWNVCVNRKKKPISVCLQWLWPVRCGACVFFLHYFRCCFCLWMHMKRWTFIISVKFVEVNHRRISYTDMQHTEEKIRALNCRCHSRVSWIHD